MAKISKYLKGTNSWNTLDFQCLMVILWRGGGKGPTSIFEILPWGANSGILKGWVGPSGEIPKYSRNIPEPEKSET